MHDNELIKMLFQRVDDKFEKGYSATELQLLKAYKQTLTEIKNQFNELWAKFSGTPTELIKFNRLATLEEQISEAIKKLTGFSINVISGEIKKTFVTSYKDTGSILETGTGLNLGFATIPKEAIKYAVEDNLWLDLLKNHNAKLLTDTKREVETFIRTNVRQEVVSGLAQGKTYAQVTRAIKDRFDVTAFRAKTITFTEMHKSHSKGRNEGINKAIESGERLGIKIKKIWKHNPVGIPRPDHLAMDGKEADENGLFHVGGEKMEAPGLGTKPENNINCFIGSVNVLSPSPIQKVMKRYYSGELIEIITAGGIQITGTPNHPIMTPKGWVPLNSLNKGCDVFSTSGRKNLTNSHTNVNYTPMIFSEIFNLCSIIFSGKRVNCTEKDFHGDGSKGDVDIITTDGFLWNTMKPKFFHPISKNKFTLANLRKAFLFCYSSIAHFFFRWSSALIDLIGSCGNAFPFIKSHSGHSDNQGILTASPLDIILYKNALNNSTTNSKFGSNLKLGISRKIHFNNFGGVGFLKDAWMFFVSRIRHLSFVPLSDIVFHKDSINNWNTNSFELGEFLNRNTGIVEVDNVVNIRKFNFSGHIYNLQTKDNYYLVRDINIRDEFNGDGYLIAHNCHCNAQTIIEDL